MGKFFFDPRLTILVLLFVFCSPLALANFEFSPITMSITTSGKTNHAIAQVVNRGQDQIPIVVRVTERKLLEDGSEDRPETSELAVFPSQFILGAKESKSIKVSWQGEENLPSEKAFRIIVEEVPVEFSAKTENKGMVKILLNYVGTVYVNSVKTEGELSLEKVNVSDDKKQLVLLFVNKGNGHAILKTPEIEITAKATDKLTEKKIVLSKKDISMIEGKNILALSRLKIQIPRPVEFNGYENFEWKFSYGK